MDPGMKMPGADGVTTHSGWLNPSEFGSGGIPSASVTFQPNWSGFRKFEFGFQYLTVACAVSDIVFDDDQHFVPLLRLIVFQFFVRPGNLNKQK